jgi:hypothetical protein
MTTQIVYNDFTSAAIDYIKSPRITSITYPSGLAAGNPAGGQTIAINGAGFASGAAVYIGSTIVPVITIVSSTQITFTSSATAAGSYLLYVFNLDGGTAVYPVGISFGTTPGWITAAGTLGTVYETRAVAFTVVAAALSTITYTLASGSLPPGATLGSSSGIISGTAQNTATSTTYTFTITARDTISQTANRTFSITISPDVVTWAAPIANTTITVYEFGTVSQSLAATSAIGADVTYTTSTLPYGVGLAGNLVAGSPNAVGTTVVTATATTANGRSATRNFTVTVLADSVTWTSPLNGNTIIAPQNSAYSKTLSATSAAGRTITYSAVNSPPGLSLSGAVISGTPTGSGSYTGSLVATAATTNRQTAITVYWGVYTVPDAPTIGSVTKGGGYVTVSYTQPAYDGNSPITSYTAVSNPGGITGTVLTALSGSVTVSGLNSSVSYTFSVYATNAAGNGASSGASVVVVPNAAPGVPVLTANRISTTQVNIVFTAPTDNGSAITSYTANNNPTTVTQSLYQSGGGTFSFTSLSPGINYTFSVYATNAVGSGSAGTVSSYTASVPDAPFSASAAPSGANSISVSFFGPYNNGGFAITNYTVTSSPGSITASGAGSPITVSGLTTGTNYTFTVYATNSIGNSVPSAASNISTTYTVPGTPTIGTATLASPTTATVSYTAPVSNGSTPITSYTAVSSPGSYTGTLSQAGSGTITVTLPSSTVDVRYTFTVYATNVVGNSSNSTASNQIAATANTGQVEYTTSGTYYWTAPAGITSVSVVAVGAGGGGAWGPPGGGGGSGAGAGGGLGWKNNISVVPGNSYLVVVGAGGDSYAVTGKAQFGVGRAGGDSYFINTGTVAGYGGGGGNPGTGAGIGTGAEGGSGGGTVGDGGGSGGPGGTGGQAGGGGAGGYAGNGGNGNYFGSGTAKNGTGGAGAGGVNAANNGGGGGGGGVGIYGQGVDGISNNLGNTNGGRGGSGGQNGGSGANERVLYGAAYGGYGGGYGGGGGSGKGETGSYVGGGPGGVGGSGAVRIIWGSGRAFSSLNTANI